MDNIYQDKQRIIQEFVPGKQVTMAHIIANPDPVLYQKLGLDRYRNQSCKCGSDFCGSFQWQLSHRWQRC